MRIGNWQFTPGFWPSLVALVLLPLFIKLGFWQLDRAHQKEQQYQQVVHRHQEPASSLNSQDMFRADKSDLLWRKVSARGRYAHEQFVLDNQVVNGEPGYFVLTPFHLAGTDKWVLVNRGWVPAGDDRSRLPDINVPAEDMDVSGEISDVPPTGLFLENAPVETMSGAVYRIQRVDIDKIAGLIRHDLLPFVVELTPAAEHGYVREWRLPGSGKERNLGYAFQWFAFAVTLVIIYLVVNLKRIR